MINKTEEEIKFFIFKTSNDIAEEFGNEYRDNMQMSGVNKLRDYMIYPETIDWKIREFYGLDGDACFDAMGIFDEVADIQYGIMERAEWVMMYQWFEENIGMNTYDIPAPKANPAPARRAEEVLYECADLMQKKGAAYNGFPQAEYYPYGLRDIWYMCFTKVKRLESQIVRDGEHNFEGIEDSARDLINYAAFLVEYAEGKMQGQEK